MWTNYVADFGSILFDVYAAVLLCREPTPDQHHMYNNSSGSNRHQRLLHSLRMRKRPRVRLREGEPRPEEQEEVRRMTAKVAVLMVIAKRNIAGTICLWLNSFEENTQ
jgi:hypothetical protein